MRSKEVHQRRGLLFRKNEGPWIPSFVFEGLGEIGLEQDPFCAWELGDAVVARFARKVFAMLHDQLYKILTVATPESPAVASAKCHWMIYQGIKQDKTIGIQHSLTINMSKL